MLPSTPAPGLPKLLKANWTRGLAFVLLCVGLLVVTSSDALHAALIRMLAVTETLIDAYPLAGTLFVILFSAAAAMLAFVSSAVIVPVAVYKWGAPISVLLFQMAMPSEVPGYLLGLLRYRFVLYLVALGVTEAPYAAATVYLGESFLARRPGALLLIAAAVGSVSLLALLALQRRLSAARPRRLE